MDILEVCFITTDEYEDFLSLMHLVLAINILKQDCPIWIGHSENLNWKNVQTDTILLFTPCNI